MLTRIGVFCLYLVGASAFLGSPSTTVFKQQQLCRSAVSRQRLQPMMGVAEGQGAAPFGTATDLRCEFLPVCH
jgi:hypothetical protein